MIFGTFINVWRQKWMWAVYLTWDVRQSALAANYELQYKSVYIAAKATICKITDSKMAFLKQKVKNSQIQGKTSGWNNPYSSCINSIYTNVYLHSDCLYALILWGLL